MKIITQVEIKEINRLYLELKTYAAVSRAMGISPATVKKYIIKDFNLDENIEKETFNKELPEFDPILFRKKDWGDLCVLTNNELDNVKKLWKELEL